MFRYVNQITIDGIDYVAYRDDDNPMRCRIVRGDDSVETDQIASVWNPDILPTLFY